MFHQIEGIYVDENVSFANLKDVIYQIITYLFGKDDERLDLDHHIFLSLSLQLR